jgi:hypothetical protein
MNRVPFAFAFVVAALPATLVAQQPQQKLPDCTSAEHHQFDYWIGSWDVFDAAGKKIGTNEVTSMFRGCALKEHWEGAGGSVGESFSAYDRAVKQWHQTWVDNIGNVWKIDGNPVGGNIVMTRVARSVRDTTKMVTYRWSWIKQDSDHVIQRAENSMDGGKTWNVNFDGHYVRRNAKQ